MEIATTTFAIKQHNQRPAAVWSAGGKEYDQISRGIADAIEHCVLRLHPQPGRTRSRSLDRNRMDLASRRTPWRQRDRRRHCQRVAGDRQKQSGRGRAADPLPPRRRREPSIRRRRVRRGGVHVRRHVREPARGRCSRAREGLSQGRADCPYDMVVRQHVVRDVRGHEAVHAPASQPRSAVTI